MELTKLHVKCLSTASDEQCVRIGDHVTGAVRMFYPKKVVFELINEGFLKPTEHFNQYVVDYAVSSQ